MLFVASQLDAHSPPLFQVFFSLGQVAFGLMGLFYDHFIQFYNDLQLNCIRNFCLIEIQAEANCFQLKNIQPLLIYKMEEDPVFKEMVRKSFILKKFPDLQIPIVKKQVQFKHEAVTTLTLATLIHLFVYPFDTIKTRLIAKSQFSDIARFSQNNVAELTTYMGIARGYGAVMIGNLCHLTVGRESLVLAAGLEGFLKTWIDMSKISKQMGNAKGDLQIMKKSFLPCAFYGILRDVLFRTTYVHLSTYFHNRYLSNSRFYDERKRVNNLFTAVIVATIISQPLEVCFVKAASQRSLKFENVFKIPGQIYREEGLGKIFIGGLWPRLVYNALSTMILANTYEPFLEASMEAF